MKQMLIERCLRLLARLLGVSGEQYDRAVREFEALTPEEQDAYLEQGLRELRARRRSAR